MATTVIANPEGTEHFTVAVPPVGASNDVADYLVLSSDVQGDHCRGGKITKGLPGGSEPEGFAYYAPSPDDPLQAWPADERPGVERLLAENP